MWTCFDLCFGWYIYVNINMLWFMFCCSSFKMRFDACLEIWFDLIFFFYLLCLVGFWIKSWIDIYEYLNLLEHGILFLIRVFKWICIRMLHACIHILKVCIRIAHVCTHMFMHQNPNLGFLLFYLFHFVLITCLASISLVFTCLGLESVE